MQQDTHPTAIQSKPDSMQSAFADTYVVLQVNHNHLDRMVDFLTSTFSSSRHSSSTNTRSCTQILLLKVTKHNIRSSWMDVSFEPPCKQQRFGPSTLFREVKMSGKRKIKPFSTESRGCRREVSPHSSHKTKEAHLTAHTIHHDTHLHLPPPPCRCRDDDQSHSCSNTKLGHSLLIP
jgi:hypothetical protein